MVSRGVRIGTSALPKFGRARFDKIRTARSIFLSSCSPVSSNSRFKRFPICSRTTLDTAMPSGGAMLSSLAAMFDSVAEDILAFNNHIADIHSNPKSYALVVGQINIARDCATLDIDCTGHRVDHTREIPPAHRRQSS